MNHSLPGIHAAGTPDAADRSQQPATCPGCHTDAALSRNAVDAGESWRCVRCGQRWDAARLATVVAYDAWMSAHERRSRAGDHAVSAP